VVQGDCHQLTGKDIDNLCHRVDRRIQGDPPMATMNISLPDAMKSWVEAQAVDGAYSNSSDFVRDLIRRDQQRQSQIAAMQAKVDEARASGVSPLSMDDIRRHSRDHHPRRANAL
jgi:antitoxin ParD1/3/4